MIRYFRLALWVATASIGYATKDSAMLYGAIILIKIDGD
jgi:hypothetical protein